VADIQIVPIEDAVVLKDRSSELLILPDHVVFLKSFSKSKDFAKYFLDQALMNRSARKLYEAWLRRDSNLWRKLYETIRDMEIKDFDKRLKELKSEDSKPKPAKKEEPAKKEKKVAKKTEAEKPAKKVAKKTTKKATTKKTTAKKTTKKATTKKTTKKVAKKTKKKTTKKKTSK